MNIYIIGAGVMGSSIAKILAKKGQKVFVYDKAFVKTKALARHKNISAVKNLNQFTKANFIILSVKPFHIAEVANEIKACIKPLSVLVSIAAGIPISKIQKLFNHKTVVRLMPNLGLSVGQGIAVWKAEGLIDKQKILVKKLLNQFTEHFEAQNESDLDAVTAISGSGPAYFFYLADALQKAARNLGFDQKMARALVGKTFLGAAALQSGVEYSDLISRVASKKGTTEAALKIFKKHRVSEIIIKAVQVAKKRAEEISRQ